MADSAVVITSGTGTNIDTRTEATNGNHRQVVVLGDPATNAGVAPVDATNGLAVDVKQSALPSGAATSAKQDTGNTSIAAVNTDTTAIKTSVQLLDDAVFVDDADWTDDTSKHINVGGVYQSSPHTVTDGDVTPFLTDANGRQIVAATDNGGSLTVDGTVAVTNAGLTELEAAIDTEMQVDVVGALPAGNNNIGDVDIASIAAGTNAIGKVGHDITGIAHGVTTVTTAGTDVVLAASTACKRVTIQAQTDNTGTIAVGGSGVDATEATGTGIILYPGDIFELEADNLADIYIDSTVNGEGVRFTYFT